MKNFSDGRKESHHNHTSQTLVEQIVILMSNERVEAQCRRFCQRNKQQKRQILTKKDHTDNSRPKRKTTVSII